MTDEEIIKRYFQILQEKSDYCEELAEIRNAYAEMKSELLSEFHVLIIALSVAHHAIVNQTFPRDWSVSRLQRAIDKATDVYFEARVHD